MAEPLSSVTDARNSADVSQAIILGFDMELDDLDREAKAITESRKKIRLRMKQAGINIRGFDRARKDAQLSGVEREAIDHEYRRNMAWRAKPVGFQPALDLDEAIDEGMRALNVHELHRVDTDGLESGKNGRRRDSNNWTPGTEAYQRWDNAWLRGQAMIASTLSNSGGGAQDNDPPQKRGRGRPRKIRENGATAH
jgi:hypothetical protein